MLTLKTILTVNQASLLLLALTCLLSPANSINFQEGNQYEILGVDEITSVNPKKNNPIMNFTEANGRWVVFEESTDLRVAEFHPLEKGFVIGPKNEESGEFIDRILYMNEPKRVFAFYPEEYKIKPRMMASVEGKSTVASNEERLNILYNSLRITNNEDKKLTNGFFGNFMPFVNFTNMDLELKKLLPGLINSLKNFPNLVKKQVDDDEKLKINLKELENSDDYKKILLESMYFTMFTTYALNDEIYLVLDDPEQIIDEEDFETKKSNLDLAFIDYDKKTKEYERNKKDNAKETEVEGSYNEGYENVMKSFKIKSKEEPIASLINELIRDITSIMKIVMDDYFFNETSDFFNFLFDEFDIKDDVINDLKDYAKTKTILTFQYIKDFINKVRDSESKKLITAIHTNFSLISDELNIDLWNNKKIFNFEIQKTSKEWDFNLIIDSCLLTYTGEFINDLNTLYYNNIIESLANIEELNQLGYNDPNANGQFKEVLKILMMLGIVEENEFNEIEDINDYVRNDIFGDERLMI